MALNVQVGTFNSPGATGNQTITLPGSFDCKAVIVIAGFRSTDGVSDNDIRYSVGYGTYRGSVVSQYCVSQFENDAATSSDTARAATNTALIKLLNAGTPTVDAEADLVSLNSGDFVVNWVDLPTATTRCHYIALGGSAITDALVHVPTLTGTVASEDVTVVSGFGQPDLIFCLGHAQNPAQTGSATGDSGIQLGIAKESGGTIEQRCTNYCSDDGITTQESGGEQVDALVIESDSAGSSENGRGELSARSNWPTDGFQIDYSNQLASSFHRSFLSIKGTFTTKITSGSSPTGAPTVVQTYTGNSTTKGAIVWGGREQTNSGWWADGDVDNGGFVMGFTDGTNEGCIGFNVDDAIGTMTNSIYESAAKVIQYYENDGASAILAEADSSFSGNDLNISWNDTEGVAREYNVLLIGDTPAITTPVFYPVAQRQFGALLQL